LENREELIQERIMAEECAEMIQLDGLFNKQEAFNKMKGFKKIPCPFYRLEREKRIVYAFEGIKCPTIKDTENNKKY